MTDRIDFGGRPWHAIPRDALRDPRLSLKGRGALVSLLSHEEGWVRSAIATLMREAHCGRDAAKAAMAELREAGYAELITERDLEGHLRRHYVIFAESRSSTPQTSGTLGDGKPIGRETHRTGNQANEVEALDVDALEVREPSLGERTKPRRKKDPIWDGFVRWLGRNPETDSERGAWNKAAKELRDIGVDSADEVVRRGLLYEQRYLNAARTPNALVAHWSEFDGSLAQLLPRSRQFYEMTDEELEAFRVRE